MVRFGIKAKSHRHRRLHTEEVRLIIPDQFFTSVHITYPTEVLVPIPNLGFADVEEIIGVPMAAVIQKVPGVISRTSAELCNPRPDLPRRAVDGDGTMRGDQLMIDQLAN